MNQEMKHNYFKALIIACGMMLFHSQSSSQCFIRNTHAYNEKSGKAVKSFTPRSELIYELKKGHFNVSTTLEKTITTTTEYREISFNIVFDVVGRVDKLIIPDVAEFIFGNGERLSIYIPSRSGVKDLGYTMISSAYGAIEDDSDELKKLMNNQVKFIILKDLYNSVTITLDNPSLYSNMLKCLVSKN